MLDMGNVMEVSSKLGRMKFELRDESGTIVPATNEISWDGMMIDLGMLRLPHDSELRFKISLAVASVPNNQTGLMDLGVQRTWEFPAGTKHSYTLSAAFTIAEGKGREWSGTIEIPATALPGL